MDKTWRKALFVDLGAGKSALTNPLPATPERHNEKGLAKLARKPEIDRFRKSSN
jgi:hypothetical protein